MKKPSNTREERSGVVSRFLKRGSLGALTGWVGDEDVTTYAPRGSY